MPTSGAESVINVSRCIVFSPVIFLAAVRCIRVASITKEGKEPFIGMISPATDDTLLPVTLTPLSSFSASPHSPRSFSSSIIIEAT